MIRIRAAAKTVLFFFLFAAQFAAGQIPESILPPQSVSQGEKPGKYSGIPYEMRQKLEAQDAARASQRDNRPIEHLVATPWLNKNGEQLVGIVEDREMTKSQLARRVNLLLQIAPPAQNAADAEDRRIIYESRVLSDWKEMAILAHHAEVKGTMVTDAEVGDAQKKLLEESDSAAYENGVHKANLIGIPEADMRGELRDGLLVEKYIRRRMKESVTDEVRHKLFDAGPGQFVEPTRVNAWHLCLPAMQTMTPDQIDADEKVVKRYAKLLRKASEPADYDKLMADVKTLDPPLLLKPAKWYDEQELLEPELKAALFGTNAGKMSDVFRTSLGWHVVKIVERKDGERVTFENAVPKIDNFLFDQMKNEIYAQVAETYKVKTAAGGLQHWNKPEAVASAMTLDAGAGAGPAEVLVKDMGSTTTTAKSDAATNAATNAANDAAVARARAVAAEERLAPIKGELPPAIAGDQAPASPVLSEPDLEALRKRLKPKNKAEMKLLAPLPPPPPEK